MKYCLLLSHWQACLQPTTWFCQKWFTKLLWRSMRRELRLLLRLVPLWISAVQGPPRDSTRTILSSSSSDTTPPWAFCFLGDIALLSDHWTFRIVVNILCRVSCTLFCSNINLIENDFKKIGHYFSCTLNSCHQALLNTSLPLCLLHHFIVALLAFCTDI